LQPGKDILPSTPNQPYYMNKYLPLLFIGVLVFSSCRKHGQVDPPVTPDPPSKTHFTSIFKDTVNAIVSGTSHGSDFATSVIKDTTYAGATYLKILVRQKADWGPYENVEILINHAQLTTGWKGKYKINFDGSTAEPASLKHTYNSDDTVNPVTLYSSKKLKGEGYVEITDYNKERKLVTGIFHSSAADVPDPFYGLLTTSSHWDALLDGEFNSIKIQ
jgi:hypothetical protein